MKQRILMIGLLFAVAMVFVYLWSETTSPLYYDGGYNVDSQIFQYIGFAMTQGKVPYTDLFDHKGLLLYIYNALGYLLSPRFGVMLLQGMNLAATLSLWYWCLVSVRIRYVRLLLTVLSLLLLMTYYQGGNLSEEWSLPFISYPFAAYVRMIQSGRCEFHQRELFAIGLCIGALCLLRLNNAVPVVSLLLYCLAENLYLNRYAYAGRALVIISLSFVAAVATGVLFMLTIGGWQGLKDMWFANITFNLAYSENKQTLWFLQTDRIRDVYKSLLPIILLLPFAKKQWRIVVPLVFAAALTMLTMGDHPHFHYQMVLLPIIVTCMACYAKTSYGYVLIIAVLLLFARPAWREVKAKKLPNDDTFRTAFAEMISAVPHEERKLVWNQDGAFLIQNFIEAGVLQQNRMLLPWQVDRALDLYESEVGRLVRERPKYVILVEYEKVTAIDFKNKSLLYDEANNYAQYHSDRHFVKENYNLLSTAKMSNGTRMYMYKKR